jgi:hypothetical protein
MSRPAICSCQPLKISPPIIEGEIELQGITYPLMAYSLPHSYGKHLEAKQRILCLDDVGTSCVIARNLAAAFLTRDYLAFIR